MQDVRVIPSAQFNKALGVLSDMPIETLDRLPILKYRVQNLRNDRHVRGLLETDTWHCNLALDDMAVVKDDHYPCIIHLREGGQPIGKVGPSMRKDRAAWIEKHEPLNDPICKANCLDVCVDFNRKCHQYKTENK